MQFVRRDEIDDPQITPDAYYVKETAYGDGSGSDWDNAMDISGFVNLLAKSDDQSVSNSNAGILDGCTIYMAGGTYTLSERLFVEYSGYTKQVEIEIMGGYDPASTGTDNSMRDITIYETILSGGNSTSLFYFGNQTDITFDGITFAFGNAGSDTSQGGVMTIANGTTGIATVTLHDCTIRDSYCTQGAAILCSAGQVKLDNVLLTNNSCDSRGIVKLSSSNAIVFSNACTIKDNNQSGSFGYAFHVSSGHLCLNNTVITNNSGANGAVNGAGSMCLVNSTIIANNTGGAVRCESAQNLTSMLMNCIVINEMSDQYAIHMSNNTGYLTSKGYNLLGSGISETNGAGTQFIENSTDTNDCDTSSLGLVFDDSQNTFTWDGNVSAKTTADDIKSAIYTFQPEGQTSLGTQFVSWLESLNAFDTDHNGNSRNTNAMWPGAYQN